MIIFDDFNLVTNQNLKRGGNPIDLNITNVFNNTIANFSLSDICFKGNMATWNFNQEGYNFIKGKLDRFLATIFCMNLLLHYLNTHLETHRFDPKPISLDFNHPPPQFNPLRCFIKMTIRFDNIWLKSYDKMTLFRKLGFPLVEILLLRSNLLLRIFGVGDKLTLLTFINKSKSFTMTFKKMILITITT